MEAIAEARMLTNANKIGGGKSRNSNIELLRIVSMLMIVAHHVLVHGIADSIDSGLLHFLDAFLIYGVNVFLLISGYFTIKVKWKSVLNLFWICCFWKLFHLFFGTIVLGHQYTLMDWFIKPLAIPFSSGGWFVDTYILLMLLSPILNIALGRMSKKELNVAIILMTIFNVVYCWMLGRQGNASGYMLWHFVYMYGLGFYIRHACFNLKFKGLWFIVCSLLTFLLCEILGMRNAYSYNSPFVIIGAVLLFMVFRDLQIQNRAINQVALSVLPIYLATDGGVFGWSIYSLYDEVILAASNTWTAIMQIAAIAIGVCLFVVLVDRIRIGAFARGIAPALEFVLNKYSIRK